MRQLVSQPLFSFFFAVSVTCTLSIFTYDIIDTFTYISIWIFTELESKATGVSISSKLLFTTFALYPVELWLLF